jgi:hypothetical protein
MSGLTLPTTVVGLSVVVIVVAYVGLIAVPTWTSFTRVWERLAASVLSLCVLVVLLGLGVGLGFAVIWSYDRFA